MMIIGFITLFVLGFTKNSARMEANEIAEERLETIEKDLDRAKYDIDSMQESNSEVLTRHQKRILSIEKAYCIDVLGGEEYYGGECHDKAWQE